MIHELFYRPAFKEMFFNQIGDIFGLELFIKNLAGVYYKDWPLCTEAVTAREGY
ncbi:hypothetical protein BMS3Bbin07_00793 [bacterium BMS3Bbin07]|nr:hypothetical protein BMS3Bbin07_00793 [bacterium BMS3Bbin07]